MSNTLRLTALTILGLLVLSGNPLYSSDFVGQVISSDTMLDQRSVPAGTTIPDGATVTTADDPAILHLATGQLVQVAQNSSAVVAGNGDGVQLAVLTGELAYREANGETVALSAGSSSSLFQEGEIGSGTPVSEGDPDEEIAICHLEDSTPELIQLCNVDNDNDDCDWDRIKVERRDLEYHLAHGDIYADKDLRTPDMNPEASCGKVVAWWWGGAGAVAAGIVLSDDSSTSTPPGVASPIVP